jgi:hypothetical protein
MTENQSVQEVELDIDNWDVAPGGSNIITSTEKKEEAKPNMFSRGTQDMSFLDEEEKPDVDKAEVIKDTLDLLDQDIKGDNPNLDEPGSNKGRPKTEKNGLVEFLKKRIESKEMFAFDDFDETKQDLGDYLTGLSEKDVDELWQANVDNLKTEVASRTPKEFFESLPDELQYAAKYVMDGGQDLKGLFASLAAVEEVRQLDPAQEGDREYIVRSYLQARGESTEDIEDEINTLKDLGTLEKKAKQYKPKLDAMQEELVQARIAEQEQRQYQQQQAAQAYTQNVYEALRPAEINGIKLDKKTQAQLYSGLTQAQYPSVSGRPTNQLGHLLEKYQFVEPNYPLIAEALWLLSDPEGYRKNLQVVGKNQATENTVRQLKTEQARKNSYTATEDDDRGTRKITRQTNIFKR